MAQFTQRLSLNLSDALPGYVELLAHLLKGATSSVFKTKPELDYAVFPRSKSTKHLFNLLLEQLTRSDINRRQRIAIFNKVAKVAIFLITNG